MKRVVRRFNLLFIFIFVLFTALILRLMQLMLVDGPMYAKAAGQVNIKQVSEVAPRGWIYDVNGVPLARNVPVFRLSFLDEGLSRDDIIRTAIALEALLRPLGPSLNKGLNNRVDILEALDVGWRYVPVSGDLKAARQALRDGKPFQDAEWKLEEAPLMLPRHLPRIIAFGNTPVDLPEDVVFQLGERLDDFPGVRVVTSAERIYPYGDLATQVIGYTRPVKVRAPERIEELLSAGYSMDEPYGEMGVEASYESVLKGMPGVAEVHVNNLTGRQTFKPVYAAKPGNNIVLTLDARFQRTVESILKEEAERFNAIPEQQKAGALTRAMAVVMNPWNGDILAMAKYPGYDLNCWNKPSTCDWATIDQFNSLTGGGYLPGSTFKLITVMFGLNEGLIGPQEKVLSTGTYRIGRDIKKDWKSGGHGWTDGIKAIKESINTYMYDIAMRLYRRSGDYASQFDVVRRFAAQFGLGVKTGIDLPDEGTGKKENQPLLGRLADMMIGQYDSYTPIQLAQYVSTIANGGRRIRPHVVHSVNLPVENAKGPGPVVYEIQGEVLGHVEVDPRWLDYVKEGMRLVTEPGGTAGGTFVGSAVKVAAKTGTAQVKLGVNNSLIIGYAPADKPEIAFAVVVPNVSANAEKIGGPIAHRIARRIIDAYFGVTPLEPLHPVVP